MEITNNKINTSFSDGVYFFKSKCKKIGNLSKNDNFIIIYIRDIVI